MDINLYNSNTFQLFHALVRVLPLSIAGAAGCSVSSGGEGSNGGAVSVSIVLTMLCQIRSMVKENIH